MRTSSSSSLRTSRGGREEADDPLGIPSRTQAPPAGRPRVAVSWRILRSRGAIVVTSTLMFFLLWQLAVWILQSPYLPGPAQVARALAETLTKRDFIGFTIGEHIRSSLTRILLGYALAAAVAVPLGLLAGWVEPLETFLAPWVEMARPIPPLAWIPFAIVFFGSPLDAVFIVFLASFFPIFLNTVTGVKSVEPLLLDAARTLGARRSFLFTRVIVPGAS